MNTLMAEIVGSIVKWLCNILCVAIGRKVQNVYRNSLLKIVTVIAYVGTVMPLFLLLMAVVADVRGTALKVMLDADRVLVFVIAFFVVYAILSILFLIMREKNGWGKGKESDGAKPNAQTSRQNDILEGSGGEAEMVQGTDKSITLSTPKRAESYKMGSISRCEKSEMRIQMKSGSEGAEEVIILAGLGSFLKEVKGEDGLQFQEILSNASKYKILLDDQNERKYDIEALCSLKEKNAEIKAYPKVGDGSILKGRLNVTGGVFSAMLCQNIEGNEYEILRLNDNTLVKIVYDFFAKTLAEKGTNVFIKYICFDLAGVYFSGDIETFWAKLRRMGLSIYIRAKDHLCINERLATDAEYDIIDYLKDYFKDKRSGDIIEKRKDAIVRAWQKTWKINKEMEIIVKKLKVRQYQVAICSNCDEMNGDMYERNGAFQELDTFLSYKLGKSKPKKEYFECIKTKYQCYPYEILFIDDCKENIDEAKKVGFATLYVDRNLGESEKAKTIENGLAELDIRINEAF